MEDAQHLTENIFKPLELLANEQSNFKELNNELLLERLLQKQYFHPNFLDVNLNGRFDPKKISMVITTYNRSPHALNSSKAYLNPLGLCLKSLLNQKKSGLSEIVVVDDGSKDFTEEVVHVFKLKSESTGIDIVYLKNEKNKGSLESIKKGIDHTKNNLIMLGDDDCIFSEYALFGASYSFDHVKNEGINIAALHLPVYPRSTEPMELIDINEIGVLNMESGKTTGNVHGFPKQYLHAQEYINNKLKILKPIEIKNLGGIFLVQKNIFNDAGGLPNYFTWKNSYSEFTELSLRLVEAGYKIFHSPDPKFYAMHLKYGSDGDVLFSDNNWKKNKEKTLVGVSLEDIIQESKIPRGNTGCRVNAEEWCYSKIISYFVMFLKRDRIAAFKWSKDTRLQFVENNDDDFCTAIGIKIDSYDKRNQIWHKAINDGVEIVNNLIESKFKKEDFYNRII